jgi:hypothetical protein
VGVDLQRPAAERLLESRNQGGHTLRNQQAAGILEKYGIDAECNELLDLAHVVGVGVHRAVRVDQAARDVEPVPLPRLDRNFQVAHIV